VLRNRKRRKKRRRELQHFVPKACVVGALRFGQRESLQANPPWPKGLKGLRRRWRGLKLRFQEFQLSLKLLRPMREGRRCNHLGLPACSLPRGLLSPALLPGFLVVKPRSLRLLGSNCHLRRLRSTNIIPAKKSTSTMNSLFLIPANSRIYQRKSYRCTSLRWFHRQERLLSLRVFLLSSLIVSSLGWENVFSISFEFLL